MPGVVVNTGVRVGGTGVEVAPSSTFFVVGTAFRGRTATPFAIRSMADFENEFGGYDSNCTLHQHLETFFEEGGVRAIVQRLVGPAAAAGSNTFLDVDEDVCMTVTAANPGSWSSSIDVEIVNAGSTFSLAVKVDGVTVVSSSSLASTAAAIALINNTAPHLVVATAGASSLMLDTQTETLSAGDDDIDNGAFTNDDFVEALDNFGDDLGTGAVAIPEKYGSTIWGGLRDHAEATKRIAICGFDEADSADDAITSAGGYAGTTAGEKSAASHVAFYWPMVSAPDGNGGTRTLSPESYVAAVRAKNIIANRGPWKPAAGISSAARFIVGLVSDGSATKVNKSVGNVLDEGRVNAIRIIDGQIRIYGARSVSADENNWRYITYRDTVNQVATTCERALEQYVFSPIDSRKNLFGAISSSITSILDTVKDNGGLYPMVDAFGSQVDRGYSIEVSDALNPITELAQGRIVARVGVRVAGVADLITLTITKSSLTAAL